ncbi:hypothetical protein [Bradyrhizobium genosp. P]|uniref:hypothetical protein n=1 Tax=Bradyrhizobium genosp. P TaxID=83641 RepID=UPI003CEFD55B
MRSHTIMDCDTAAGLAELVGGLILNGLTVEVRMEVTLRGTPHSRRHWRGLEVLRATTARDVRADVLIGRTYRRRDFFM